MPIEAVTPRLRSWGLRLIPGPVLVLGVPLAAIFFATGNTLPALIVLVGFIPFVISLASFRTIARVARLNGDALEWSPFLGPHRTVPVNALAVFQGLQLRDGSERQVRVVFTDGSSLVVMPHTVGGERLIAALHARAAGARVVHPSALDRACRFWRGFYPAYVAMDAVSATRPKALPRKRGAER
jgi:hypothetical protein